MTAPPPSLCNRTPQSAKQCEPEPRERATKGQIGRVDVDNPKETGGAIATANAIVEVNHTNTEPAAHTDSNSSNTPSLSESPTTTFLHYSTHLYTCSPPQNSTSELPDAKRIIIRSSSASPPSSPLIYPYPRHPEMVPRLFQWRWAEEKTERYTVLPVFPG